jgi:hypothetical protein
MHVSVNFLSHTFSLIVAGEWLIDYCLASMCCGLEIIVMVVTGDDQ